MELYVICMLDSQRWIHWIQCIYRTCDFYLKLPFLWICESTLKSSEMATSSSPITTLLIIIFSIRITKYWQLCLTLFKEGIFRYLEVLSEIFPVCPSDANLPSTLARWNQYRLVTNISFISDAKITLMLPCIITYFLNVWLPLSNYIPHELNWKMLHLYCNWK